MDSPSLSPVGPPPVPAVAVVLGTYNRLPLLMKAVESIRLAAGNLSYEIIVVDGGSTDGSREWLAAQHDVVLIGQRGPLTGAVKAFNLGFGYAVDRGCRYICHLNDDAEFMTPGALEQAAMLLHRRASIGEVAFEFDLFEGKKFDQIHSKLYANFGLVRREAGMAVARAQGDPTGRAWWNPIYRTYGADCEFGAWLWKLGWQIEPGHGLLVHDVNPQDELRAVNEAHHQPERKDSHTFWNRWPTEAHITPLTDVAAIDWEGKQLHIGCGTHRIIHYLNLDGIPGPAVDVVLDFDDLYRIPAGSATKIYWSHGPEHVYPDRLPGVFAELRRILKPGARLIVATIDFEGIYLNRYKTTKNGNAWNSALYGETLSTDHVFLSHKQAFDERSLALVFKNAGFRDVKRWDPEAYPDIYHIKDYAVTCRLVTTHVEGVA